MNEKRTERMHIMLSPSEREAARTAARMDGDSLGAFARKALAARVRETKRRRELDEALA